MTVRSIRRAGLAAVVGLAFTTWTSSASADVPASLRTAGTLNNGCVTRDAADNDTGNGNQAPYVFCDDGVPSFGGTTAPDLGGTKGVLVPAAYGSGSATYAGLPAKSLTAATVPGANLNGFIGLDVDISLPTSAPPAGGYPMIVMMHGCCGGNKTSWEGSSFDAGGEQWHYNNAWFAARGYVVVTYTARGFVNSQGQGSSGQTQLDSRSFEINDFQALACNVLATGNDPTNNWDAITGQNASIDPTKVVVTGGSYGGGFSWMAATDPRWTCNTDTGANGTAMQLAAAAPKYGWTDLAYTLVPNGLHSELPGSLPAFDGCSDGPLKLDGSACSGTLAPTGTPKSSIVSGLFLTGTNGSSNHTTFPQSITDAFICLAGVYPLELNPACATTLSTTLPEFMRERSAYYQQDYFDDIQTTPGDAVPIYNAGTLTDPLFPAYEDRRMANRLLSVDPSYPIKQYYGDYQHFTQNKAKEWGDECGSAPPFHVCALADYPGGDVNGTPATLQRTGITTRLNKFIDNYAQPAGGYGTSTQTPDVTADLSVCPDNAASLGVAPDEPGPAIGPASTFEALAPNTLTLNLTGTQTTTSTVAGNTHAADADPVGNSVTNAGACPKETSVAGAGVASYASDPLPSTETMVGAATVTIDFALTAPPGDAGFQLNARLYDVFPDGHALMVDRGVRRLSQLEQGGSQITYELHGNAWRFPAGHRIRIEITQDDTPYLKASSIPSSATLSGAQLEIPVVEGASTVGGGGEPKPPPPSSGGGAPTTAPVLPKKKKCKKKRAKRSASAAKKKRCKKKHR